MKTIKKYFTLAEHANVQDSKPYYSFSLKWASLIPDMPTTAA